MPYPSIDLALLETLLRIREEASFSRAAERLHLTQQSVSGQVKRLEALIGRPLVSRTTHAVRLTADGEALALYAQTMLAVAGQIKRHFDGNGVAGSVRIGIVEGFATNGLPMVLAQLRRAHGRLEVFTQIGETGALMTRLDAGSLDLVVGAQRPGEGRGELLCRDRLRWVGDGQGLEDPGQPVPLVLMPEPSVNRALALEALVRAGRRWTVLFESESRSSLRAAVSASLGVTAFASLMAGQPDEPAATPEGVLPELGEVEYFLRTAAGAGRYAQALGDIIRAVTPEIVRQSASS